VSAVRDPAGTTQVLSHPPFRAEVVTVGAVLRSLTLNGVDLIAGFESGTPCPDYRGWVLMPWPNRVTGGRYRFGNTIQQLSITEPAAGNALHGLVGWTLWTVAEQESARIRLACELPPQPGYPGALDLEVTYELGDEGLRVTLEATNAGRGPAPYGCGHHPHLTVGRRIDECELTVPAAAYVTVDRRGHPASPQPVDGTPFDFRAGRALGPRVVDHPFTDLTMPDRRAEAVLRDPDTGRTARVVLGQGFPWLHVYTADTVSRGVRASVALEPMTCAPDAFNSGLGLVVLEPGQAHSADYLLTGSLEETAT